MASDSEIKKAEAALTEMGFVYKPTRFPYWYHPVYEVMINCETVKYHPNHLLQMIRNLIAQAEFNRILEVK